MDWSSFLKHLEKTNISPVLLSLLRQTSLLSFDAHICTIRCQNTGLRMFLESKKEEVRKFVTNHLNNPLIDVVFVVEQSEKHKKSLSLPLIDYGNEVEERARIAGLAPSHTFENFAVSISNQVAHAAALAVSENPGKIYNPLFLYGGVGVGKTHLSHAIANKIIQIDIKKRVLFSTSEEFTNDLIELIRRKSTNELRKKYRKLDVLIVDDVQFIAGKNYVQEEFYHTFNTLIRGGSQIILTSDRPPSEIDKLESRLRSRFSGGLTIDMQDPDFELRTAILLIKAKGRNVPIEIGAAKYIAQETTDTRELEGVLLRMYAKISDTKEVITQEFVVGELNKEGVSANINMVSPQEIMRLVCAFYDVRPSLIRGPSRKEELARVRQIIMYLLRIHLKLKFEEIAFLLRRKDHTTIMHGVDKITSLSLKDDVFHKELDRIVRSLSV